MPVPLSTVIPSVARNLQLHLDLSTVAIVPRIRDDTHAMPLGKIVLAREAFKIVTLETHALMSSSICLAMLVTTLAYESNNRVGALMVPGVWVAIQLHTPDIHGGTRFIWTALVATFLIYFVVFWLLLTCIRRLCVARKNKQDTVRKIVSGE
jgi:hypothetical protein